MFFHQGVDHRCCVFSYFVWIALLRNFWSIVLFITYYSLHFDVQSIIRLFDAAKMGRSNFRRGYFVEGAVWESIDR